MKRENIFDAEFCKKLKAFYSFDEGERKGNNIGYRRTGRTFILSKILLETAIESGKVIELHDHHVDSYNHDKAKYTISRYIAQICREYEDQGVYIKVDYLGPRHNKLRAKILEGKEEYETIRVKPYPIKYEPIISGKNTISGQLENLPSWLFQNDKEFLNKNLLLLL